MRLLPMVLILFMSSCGTERTFNNSRIVSDAIAQYCQTHVIDQDKVEEVVLNLVPSTRVFRYILSAEPVPVGCVEARDRYCVLIIDEMNGSLLEMRLGQSSFTVGAQPYRSVCEWMKRKEKKVTNTDEAREVITDILILDDWLLNIGEKQKHIRSVKFHVFQPYRRIANSYGAMCSGRGDDIGIVLDSEGFVTTILWGHVR